MKALVVDDSQIMRRPMNDLPGVRVAGLMAIPPFSADPNGSRPHFARLRGILEALAREFPGRVLDAPMVPDRKYKPRTTINTLLGGAGTVFVWMVVVFSV